MFSRRPTTIVQIDQELCENIYGETPCTAQVGVTGTRKCFNTFNTCQDKDNYSGVDTLTLTFCKASSDMPTDLNALPFLSGVRTSPTRINVGGRAGRDKPLGRRGQATVKFRDPPHSDNIVDPYLSERSYDPLTRGTFWAKWLKRNPYHIGYALRIYDGYAGQSLAEMQVRHYIIEKIDGPDSSGNVSIEATDILRLADNDKAKYPALSSGKLLSGISDTATSLTITGGTLAEYEEYETDHIRIGDEVIGYTPPIVESGGDLTFNSLTRAEKGTEAESHDADDTVQACAEFVDVAPWSVVQTLLLDANVPASYIPYSTWVTDAEFWLEGLTVSNFLSEPMGTTELIGQLCEQCMFFIWWAEKDQEIKLKVVAPPTETVPLITQDNNLIQGETKIKVKPELRASEVWVSYLPRDYSEDMDDIGNFRRTIAQLDNDNPYGERRVYNIYSTWLTSSVRVSELAFRTLQRYSVPPKYLSFSMDIKDRGIELADPFDVEFKGFVDDTGQIERKRYQVISMHESPPGERIVYEAQAFEFGIGFKNGYWMASDAPDYSDATESEKEDGFFWAESNGDMPDGEAGYVWS